MSFENNESKTIGGFARNDRFSYTQRFGGPGKVANRVLVEAGAASGRVDANPPRSSSYVRILAKFLKEKGQSLSAEDESPFPFRLLHFRRTFVEKMFAIHSKVELLKRAKQPLGSYPRHYYDLFQLSRHPEVDAMLRSEEYGVIKTDYDQISKTHFPKSYFLPEGMSFACSDALFPPSELATIIGAEYET